VRRGQKATGLLCRDSRAAEGYTFGRFGFFTYLDYFLEGGGYYQKTYIAQDLLNIRNRTKTETIKGGK
jgi:hypothetical protein